MKTQELMQKWKEVYEKKNQDYGASWDKVGKIIAILFDGKEVKLTSEAQHNAFALLVRILDKLARFSNLYFDNKDAQVKDETLIDTVCDAGTYMFMMGELISNKETKIDLNISKVNIIPSLVWSTVTHPIFKVGDFITVKEGNGYIWEIVEFKNNIFTLRDLNHTIVSSVHVNEIFKDYEHVPSNQSR